MATLQEKYDAMDDLADKAIEAYCDTEDDEDYGDQLREELSWIREGRLDKIKE